MERKGYLLFPCLEFNQRSSVLEFGMPSAFPVETSVQVMLMLELYDHTRGRFSAELTLWSGVVTLSLYMYCFC